LPISDEKGWGWGMGVLLTCLVTVELGWQTCHLKEGSRECRREGDFAERAPRICLDKRFACS
jgi:hypothetical protein